MTGVLAFDLSSTCTGICTDDGRTDHYTPPAKATLIERAIATRNHLRDWLLPAPDLVVIEAIGTRHVQTAIAIATVHALVEEMLRDHQVVKVAPAVVKRYATGNGAANKHAMTMAAIRGGWDSEDSTDDEVDAWHLWTLGRHLLGAPAVPVTVYRSEIVLLLGEAT